MNDWRSKKEILDKIHPNSKEYNLLEVLIDIRDTLKYGLAK